MTLQAISESYAKLRARKGGLKVFALPVALALILLVAGFVFPDALARNFWFALPIALIAIAGFGWGLLQTSEDLREQRSINRRLSELQAQYGVAEGLAVMGSWVYDLVEDRFYWSEGSFRVFGIEADHGAPSPRAFTICIHPDDQQRWQQAHRRGVKRGQEVRIEYRYVKKGKEQIWIRSVARPEADEHGNVVRLAGIAQDITAMRAMAQQLAGSEAKFRDLTQLSSDWVWETDAEHKLSFLSESVVAELGAWVKGDIGKRFDQGNLIGLPRADWDAFGADLENHRQFEDFQYSLLDPDGNLFSVSISGRPNIAADGSFVGYRGVGRNVTKEMQQQLLLQLEGEMAAVMREHNEAERVVAAIIIAVSRMMGWSGGAHLALIPGTTSLTVRERWGQPAITRMLGDLPRQIPMRADSVEAKAWKGQAIWMRNVSQHLEFSERYQAEVTGMRAAFLAPISDEQKNVLSALLFFAPSGFRADAFLAQVAEILSRTMSLYLQRKTAEKRLLHASMHDPLTGLPNRVFLTEQLQQRLSNNEPAAVLYVDLDRFKPINDTLGHQVGDQVLIEVARRFRESIEPADVAGRIGGDEFILLLDKKDDKDEVERQARKILDAIEKPFILQNRAYFLSASIGVALSPANGTDATILIKCADSAMYQVKSEGRNDVRFFTSDRADERGDQLQLASELPLALQRNEVDLYYQPVLAVGEKRIVGMEGLIRWRHPTRGLMLPEAFLPAAEQNNLMREIGLWAIRRALDDRIELGFDEKDEMSVSVNVSPRLLGEEGFLAQLNGLLTERQFPARLLRLELTENALIDNSSKTVALLGELRRLGVQVIIDNFGTGYASLSYLRNLPVGGLKIDHTFVRDLHADRGNAAIVQAIMTLAGKLGLLVVAEGVESGAEMRALRSFECDRIQGAFVCEPLPLAQLKDFLKTVPKLRQMHDARGPKLSVEPDGGSASGAAPRSRGARPAAAREEASRNPPAKPEAGRSEAARAEARRSEGDRPAPARAR
ncbi:MAG: EAL domain-containing protein [Lautropia sp.]